MPAQTNDKMELIFTVDGDRAPRNRMVEGNDKAGAVVAAVARELHREDLEALYEENADKAVQDKTPMKTVLAGEFAVFHIGDKHKVKVEVTYNGRDEHEQFARGVTIQSVIAWAISPKGLNLQGEVCDFQLKLGTELLAPDLHIGQLASGRETVRLALVFKVKPQG